MSAAGLSQEPVRDPRPRELAVFISIRTILLVGVAVAVAWALSSVGDVLLLIFVAVFSTAVLAPVVDAMERRLPWSRGLCASMLVGCIAALTTGLLAILLVPIADVVRHFAHNIPRLVDEARHSEIGRSLDGGGGQGLQQHAQDIVTGVRHVAGGVAGVGATAFGVVTLAASATFMTLFLLIDLPGLRAFIGSLLYRDTRLPYEQITDRIIVTTSRYMLGNLAISVICAVTYGITAAILGLPYAVALAVIAGVLDMIPSVGSLIAGIIMGIVALTVSPGALVVVVLVMFAYQQAENYILQPTIIGKAADVSGFTVLVSVLVFGSLFGVVGAIVGVPILAAAAIVLDETTAARRARIAAADAATPTVRPARRS
jgi:predicted PurR-regulated permease PerM